MNRTAISAAAVIALVLGGVCRGDSWPNPTPRIFSSDDGHWAIKIVPERDGSQKRDFTAVGILFGLNDDGSERVAWKRQLVNVPVRAIPYRNYDTAFVVTLDTWGRMGYEHALAIYGKEGKLLGDFRLEDLLTEREIRDFAVLSTSSRRWENRASFHLVRDPRNPRLRIEFDFGKVLLVDLSTGGILDSAKGQTATEQTRPSQDNG